MKIQSISSLNLNKNLKFSALSNNFIKTSPLPYDTVSFSSKSKNKVTIPLDVDYSTGSKIANNLSVATSGHRAPYGSKEFTPEVINLITLGVAEYAKEHSLINGKPTVIIGGDTRKATRELLPKINDTLTKQGVDVIYMKEPTPTPLLAVSAKTFGVGISILMTASHNPWEDGGINFITPEGAVAPSEVTGEIAKHVDKIAKLGYYSEEIKPTGVSYEYDPYKLYKAELNELNLIDFENIKKSGLKVYYDGLQGTGCYVMPKLLQDYKIPFKEIVSKGQKGPNPTKENLQELKKEIQKSNDKLKIALANDGDADRFGIIDENGNFIDPNDVLLLVAYHLVKNKNLTGDIVRSQATSQLVEKLGQKYNLKTHETPVGFKYIAHDILQARKEGRDIIVAGEESGGLTVHDYIPEKDGILADFLILDLIAKENRPLSEILKDIKKDLDTETYINNYSKRLKDEATKEKVMKKVENRYNDALKGDTDFGKRHIINIEKTKEARDNIKNYRPIGDGFKFVMEDGSTVLVRKSGTEPLTRFYIEATGLNKKDAQKSAGYLEEYIEKTFSEKD